MKRIFIALTLAFICLVSFKPKETQNNSAILPPNVHQEVVHDLAAIFSPSEKQLLANKIIAYEDQTTNEIAILTVNSIYPYKIALNYATDVSNLWELGKEKSNNGLLLLFSMDDRQMAIATGLETELILTNDICQEFIDTILVPKFKTGDYFEAVNTCLDSIIVKWEMP